MNKTLFLMQGLPGSGKTTYAKMIADKHEAIIFSTDDFWYRIGRSNEPVEYIFDHSRLREAHLWNQRRTAKEMNSSDGGNIVIDNTNITQRDAQPYLILAEMFGYEVMVFRVEAPYETCLERNRNRPIDRQVPWEVISRMNEMMERIRV